MNGRTWTWLADLPADSKKRPIGQGQALRVLPPVAVLTDRPLFADLKLNDGEGSTTFHSGSESKLGKQEIF